VIELNSPSHLITSLNTFTFNREAVVIDVVEDVAMGFKYVKIRVYSFDLSRHANVEVLVDSGALFTSIPRRVLEELGLRLIARYS